MMCISVHIYSVHLSNYLKVVSWRRTSGRGSVSLSCNGRGGLRENTRENQEEGDFMVEIGLKIRLKPKRTEI